MSIGFVSRIIWSLNKLTPAMFKHPTFMPWDSQRFNRSVFDFFSLADPFVRFFYFYTFAYFPFFRSLKIILVFCISLSSVSGSSV
jgi:hypothetical protein